MKFLLSALFLLVLALPANAQQSPKPEVKESLRDRAIKRCRENRGIDCDSDRGLREWLREDTPLTDDQRQAAAASRRHREECARNKKATNC